MNSPDRREATRITGCALAGTQDLTTERTAPARHFQNRDDALVAIDVGHIPEPSTNAEYLGAAHDHCPTEYR